jgi:uncharacterized protein YjdB
MHLGHRSPPRPTPGGCRLGGAFAAFAAAVTLMLTAAPAAAQTLLRIEVRPRERIVEVGETRSMTAIGVFRGGLLRDITDQVAWASSNPGVAVVTPTRGQVTGVGPGAAFISARSAGGVSSSDSGGDARIVVPAQLESLRIVPSAVELPAGLVRSLNAEGRFTDGTTADVSDKVEWSSNNPTVVSVSNDPRRRGELTTRRAGVAVVTAIDPVTSVTSAATGGDAVVTVRPPIENIVITPATDELTIGGTRRLSARAILADDSTFPLPRSRMLWSSSDTRVASVSNLADTAGLVTALAPGTTTISAVHVETGIAARERARIVVLDRLVSLTVTPADRGLALGETRSMTATGLFANGVDRELTDEVIWASSNAAVVSVSNEPGNRGKVTARRSGVAFISARSPTGVTSTATGGDGRVRVIADMVSLRIDPREVTLPIAFAADLDAEATFADNTTDGVTNNVEWESSNPAVATVSNEPGRRGEVLAVGEGTAVIRAVDPGTGISSSASGGDAVVTVAGRALELFITPAEARLSLDDSRRFNVRARLDDGSTFTVSRRRVEWMTSDPDVIAVGNEGAASGIVIAVGLGEAFLSAHHLPTGLSAPEVAVGVRGKLLSLAVTPRDRSIELGDTRSMTALGTFSDGAAPGDVTDEVEWISSDENVVIVSNDQGTRGHATAVGPGVAFISAHTASGMSSTASGADARVRVPAELLSIALVPGTIRLAAGFTTTVEAEGSFADGSVGEVSRKVEWSTSDPAVAVVSNEEGEEGDVTAVGDGVAFVSVTDPATGISSADSGEDLTVTVSGQVVRLAVTPRNESLPVGLTRRFNARAFFEGDEDSFPVTRRALQWHSSDPTVATVGEEADSGLVTALAVGTTTLSVAHAASGLSSADGDGAGNARLTVPGRLVGLEVTPREQGLFIGTTQRLSALARLDDDTTFRLTNGITFRSSNPSVATIENASGERGNATGVAPGIVTVSARHAGTGLSSSTTGGDATVFVFAEPESLRVEAGRTRMRTGNRTRVRAFGRATRPGGLGDTPFIDVDISNDVDWTSSDLEVVDVDLDTNFAIAFGVGTAVISATDPVSGKSSALSGGNAIIRVVGALRKISIKPRKVRARIGGPPRELRAIGHYSDGARLDITNDVTFSTADPGIADVQNDREGKGTVLPVTPGRTTVTATEPNTGVSTRRPGRAIVKKAR